MYKLVIDRDTFDVDFVSLSREAAFDSKYQIQTEDGGLKRELIGVRRRYTLGIGFKTDSMEYHRLYEKLAEAKSVKTITVPATKGTYTFAAMQDSVTDESDGLLIGLKGENYFRSLVTTFEAVHPQVGDL